MPAQGLFDIRTDGCPRSSGMVRSRIPVRNQAISTDRSLRSAVGRCVEYKRNLLDAPAQSRQDQMRQEPADDQDDRKIERQTPARLPEGSVIFHNDPPRWAGMIVDANGSC